MLAAVGGCGGSDPAAPRLLILGMDGLDPVLLQGLMDAGRLPNFSKLAAQGCFSPLGTSMPPQSPVAWANFISGATPGTHQIYDFIHRRVAPRDPMAVVEPYLSTADVEPAMSAWWTLGATELKWGDRFRIPLVAERVESYRRGPAFWDALLAAGIDTTIYRVPANYPPPVVKRGWFGRTRFQCLCGMGTPDLLGGYGECTFFSTAETKNKDYFPGGRAVRLTVRMHEAVATLEGPANYLSRPVLDANGQPRPLPILRCELHVTRDPEAPLIKLTIGERYVLLQQGEWSDWLPIEFQTGVPWSAALSAASVPTSLPAMIRVYVKSVHPELEFYCTPMNIDPRNPANAISTPPAFAAELAAACGPYYTTGIPEDTKALRAAGRTVLTEDEFLQQVRGLVEERVRQYRHALENFDRGVLFFYFGHTDQLAHIFWRDRDPGHPGRKPEQGDRYANVIDDTYVEMDGLLGEALATLRPQDTIIVMSDHGFASFRRGVNLNRWLAENGYIQIKASSDPESELGIADFDWSRTRAYALGINSLYLNVKGREKRGIVAAEERAALLTEIEAKLLALRDANGEAVVDRVYLTETYYPGADPQIAPDMLVGYARNYRGSWGTTLGGMPRELLEDNTDRWSGDHCIAQHLVPGVLLSNRRLAGAEPTLIDLAPTILALYGVAPPPEMKGRIVLDVSRGGSGP